MFGTADGEVYLEAGEHRLNFEIPLAHNLPSSFEGFHG